MKEIEPHLIMERLGLIALIISGIFFLSTSSAYVETQKIEPSPGFYPQDFKRK